MATQAAAAHAGAPRRKRGKPIFSKGQTSAATKDLAPESAEIPWERHASAQRDGPAHAKTSVVPARSGGLIVVQVQTCVLYLSDSPPLFTIVQRA